MFTLPVDLAQQLYPDVENMDRVWNVFTEQDTDSLRKELFSLLDDPRLNIISRSDYGEEFEVALQSVYASDLRAFFASCSCLLWLIW